MDSLNLDYALHSYFRHWGFTQAEELSRLTQVVLTYAPSMQLTQVNAAAEETIREWWRAALASELGGVESARAAFLIARVAERWPGQFLSGRPVSADLVQALEQCRPLVTPDEVPKAMPPQSLVPVAWLAQLHQWLRGDGLERTWEPDRE